MRKMIIVAAAALMAFTAQAEDKTGLKNESSLGYVVTGGNSESETTSFKQKSTYAWTSDILKLSGHYIQASGSVDDGAGGQRDAVTAENWSATLRFERVLTPKIFNLFVAHGWYGDRFQGVREGHSSDIGGTYFLVNDKETQVSTDFGYRYTRELLTALPDEKVGVGRPMHPEYHYLRLFLEAKHEYSKTFAFGAWVEYTPSITDFANDQRINYSPYITSVLSDMFSLKVSYEGRYRFRTAVAGAKNTDFTFTTALLAKF
ncbi:MAG: DUF481 domain-containing protein [Pseudomonadota bacterium]